MELRAAARPLLTRLRRQRPLRAGSLIVTVFGDSILPRGGAISLRSLIALLRPFGLNERLVRTATARLTHDGWLEARRAGKLSEYRLTSGGRARFLEATLRIYGGEDVAWSGRWTVLVLPAMPAPARRRLGDELRWRGFGEIAAGVFAHPQLAARTIRAQLRSAGLPPQALIFDASLNDDDQPEWLVRLGWDLEELGMQYDRFADRFADCRAALLGRGRADHEAAYIVRTLLIHEYRRLHLRDPLLPPALLPAKWPGTRAAALCREIYGRAFAPSEAHLSNIAERLDGAMPPAAPSVMRRFGGV